MRAAVALAVVFAGALTLTGLLGYRYGHAQADTRCRRAQAEVVIAGELAARSAVVARTRVDNAHYTRLKELEDENVSLRTRLERGVIRLRVQTTGGAPEGSDAAGLDDGTRRTELHPAVAGDLAGLAGDADALAVQLRALQDWVRAGGTRESGSGGRPGADAERGRMP